MPPIGTLLLVLELFRKYFNYIHILGRSKRLSSETVAGGGMSCPVCQERPLWQFFSEMLFAKSSLLSFIDESGGGV